MKTNTPLSRQRLWQIAKKKNGNCTICGKPAQGRARCDRCAKRDGNKYRKPLKSEWAAVKWDQPYHWPDAAIAEHFGVTRRAVVYQRRKHAQSTDGFIGACKCHVPGARCQIHSRRYA